MFMTQTRERRINRANLKIDTNPFQRQHLRVTKRLGDDGVARIKVTESHPARCLRAARRNSNAPKKSCPESFRGRDGHEKRTSLPGSISKSNVRASCVFGLITSSINFT